jgi:ribosomal protein L37AE/L43A
MYNLETIKKVRDVYNSFTKTNVIPTANCGKCGHHSWEAEDDDCWKCTICGNRVYYRNNTVVDRYAKN